MEAQFGHDPGPVHIDSLHADTQRSGHFRIRIGFREELEDLSLAGRQPLKARAFEALFSLPAKSSQDHVPDFRRKERLVLAQSVDREEQLAPGIRLQQVIAGTGLERLAGYRFGIVHGKDEHLGSGGFFDNMTGCLNTANSPSRAILGSERHGCPGEGSRKGPVRPRN